MSLFIDVASNYNRSQASVLIVKLCKPDLIQYMLQRKNIIKSVLQADRIRNLLNEYLRQPRHNEFRKALKDSIYYNGGDYTPLINELRHVV